MSTIVYTLNKDNVSQAINNWLLEKHPELGGKPSIITVSVNKGEVSIQVEVNT